MSGWRDFSARRFLDRLSDELGIAAVLAPGVLAPGVLAAVDQHGAAVRDILAFGVPAAAAVAGVVLLAGYAKGVLDEAAAQGWRLPAIVDWSNADWLTLRLAAVCHLARHDQPALEA
ncbi:hypothetical protein ALI22I_09285 [Saccharothrix sp. ALI-22-I]|uniref:DUF6401 family natural product biosynthesis protein n=1 Tax=Saccharothrix sp. ALI-22-I TaxID=1933778 RepID=UPI00097C503E|nr:DUF6401 family natural product biosynthesis protein [Saccharothrix sp. ALI-22-I]ONI91255.1 hypothetical protein ALI22I_09285 [Saccharothrix sp. ALI-22-I]